MKKMNGQNSQTPMSLKKVDIKQPNTNLNILRHLNTSFQSDFNKISKQLLKQFKKSTIKIIFLKAYGNLPSKKDETANTTKNALNHQIYMDYTINKLKQTLQKFMYIIFIYEFNI